MARNAACRAPRLVAVLLAGAAAFLALSAAGAAAGAGRAFLSPAPRGPLSAVGVAATVATLGGAVPAFAEEGGGFLNFGKVELGGGFALNLDIPETGIVNIAVLIGGLIYLLVPLLTESMASRSKEIQTDIDDAIAKYNEATARLQQAEKARQQADSVIAEINASIAKDQQEFLQNIQTQTKLSLERQAAAAERALKDLEANADGKVEAYVQSEAVARGLKELISLSKEQKSKFMDRAIASL